MANRPQKKYEKYPKESDELGRAEEFLDNFQDENGEMKYRNMLQEVANKSRTSVDISLEDMKRHGGFADMVDYIEISTRKYVRVFSTAVDNKMPRASTDDDQNANVYDIWMKSRFERREHMMRQRQERQDAGVPQFPPALGRRYELRFQSRNEQEYTNLRNIKASQIGNLVRARGIVTRMTDVVPQVQIQTYICLVCGSETYETITKSEFTPRTVCESEQCKANKSQGKMHQQVRGSKFRRYQVVKLQELPQEVPIGHVPRAITVKLYGDLCRSVKPGDICDVSGIFLPTPYSGFRAIRAGLITDTFLEVMSIEPQKKSYGEMVLTEELKQKLEETSGEKDVYDNLATSIAPEIYGHRDLKKALLLQLVGGVNKEMADGMKIRGDINMLLMGDPGVAKSQLLKHVATIAPRSVYTTGKGSSGVGLTAAVIRDQTSGEMTLEGGALVLADKGICCIDEFDKMEEGDRTSIHEVMEQQTVSIAKAGITTTLNARTTILAAANPVYGRFNPKMSIAANINMPTSLLSRFDLTFVLRDTVDRDNDEQLAKHVAHVHQHSRQPDSGFAPFSLEFMRAYVARARQCEPSVPIELVEYVCQTYVEHRQESNSDGGGSEAFNTRQDFVTPRSLLSMLRLAQACARVHLREKVILEDVDEARRLMEKSKPQVDDERKAGTTFSRARDYTAQIFDHLKTYASAQRTTTIKKAQVLQRLTMRGNFTEAQIDETFREYEDMGVWIVSRNMQEVTFLHGEGQFL